MFVHGCVWLGAALPGDVESGVGGTAIRVYGSNVDVPRPFRQGLYSHLGSSSHRRAARTAVPIVLYGDDWSPVAGAVEGQ